MASALRTPLVKRHVAVSTSDADEFDFRAVQRIGNGKRVVYTGVEIENEFVHGVCPFLATVCSLH